MARDEKVYQFIVEQDMDKHDRLLTALGKTNLMEGKDIHCVSRMGWRKNHEGILSDHQCDILYLVASGYTDEKVAEELNLSVHTIKRLLKVIYMNLDIPVGSVVNTRTLAVARAHRLGLIWRQSF